MEYFSVRVVRGGSCNWNALCMHACISVWCKVSPKFNTRGISYGKFPHIHRYTDFAMWRNASILKNKCKRQQRIENRNFPFVCRTRCAMDALKSQYPRTPDCSYVLLFALFISRPAHTRTHIYTNTHAATLSRTSILFLKSISSFILFCGCCFSYFFCSLFVCHFSTLCVHVTTIIGLWACRPTSGTCQNLLVPPLPRSG